LEPFWESLLASKSGIGPITHFDATGFKSQIAGEVKRFDPLHFIEPELKPKRMARHTQLAYAAAMMALKDAQIDLKKTKLPNPVPVLIGVSLNSMDVLERALAAVRDLGPNRASPSSTAALIPQAPANVIADRIGTSAHATTVSSACPSGLDAVADAVQQIQEGRVEMAVAGGTDAPITPLAVASAIASGLISSTDFEPSKASRPFDSSRHYGVLSEGACVFILENAERAAARGVTPYMEITGFAKRRDYDSSRPCCGFVESITLALANGQHRHDEIDHICAYGPSDRVLDAAEVKYIKQVFGEHAYRIPVTSIKGVTGNALAAAGPFQLAACALSMRDQMIAPTTNFENGDEDCDLDFVPFTPRRAKIDYALINVRGLGGGATSVVVRRCPGE
jgi:3-oxoacyl-[acyl-carrier-protein] synthase II